MTAPKSDNLAENSPVPVDDEQVSPESREVGGKHATLIDRISELKTRANLSPTENRYVDKVVRERLGLQIRKRKRRLPRYLSPAEAALLIDTARSSSVFDGMIVELLLKTGLRIAEATNLMVADLELMGPRPLLRVVEGKGGKDRNVPMPTDFAHKLRLYLNGRRSGPVFAKQNNKGYSVRRLQERVTKQIKACGFEKHVTVHTLRHTYATILRSRGMPIQDIQMYLGHSSISTTEIYAHLVITDEQAHRLQQVMQL